MKGAVPIILTEQSQTASKAGHLCITSFLLWVLMTHCTIPIARRGSLSDAASQTRPEIRLVAHIGDPWNRGTYEVCEAALGEGKTCYLCLWMNASSPAFHLNRRKIDRLTLPGMAQGRRVDVTKLTSRKVQNIHIQRNIPTMECLSFLPALSAYFGEDVCILSHLSQHLSKLPPNSCLWKSKLKSKLYGNSCLKQQYELIQIPSPFSLNAVLCFTAQRTLRAI